MRIWMILLHACVRRAYVVQRDVPDGGGEELLDLDDLACVLVDQRLLLFEDFLLLHWRDGVHFVDEDEQLGVWRVLLELLDDFLEGFEFVRLYVADFEDVDEHLDFVEVLLGLLQVVVHELFLAGH